VCTKEPERYVGGSITNGRASHARKFKGQMPGKEGYPGLPGSELCGRLVASHVKTPLLISYVIQHEGLIYGIRPKYETRINHLEYQKYLK
jgi:hypothetical protein